MPRRFTLYILAGMILGVVVGIALHAALPGRAAATEAAGYFSLVTDVFLRLIRMIIAPLVFTTLTAGIAHMGDASAIGRVGLKTLGWFLAASICSLLIGMVMAGLLHPGTGLHLAAGPGGAAGVQTAMSLKDFLAHIFPTSIADAMAKNEILQIVVFSLFTGLGLAALGERTRELLLLVEQAATLMLKITGYVMLFAPVAVFAALAAMVTTQGAGILTTYAAFVGGFYLSLLILWALLAFAAFLAIGPRAGALLRAIRSPTLLAFSTASSEAAYPLTLERLQEFGISKRVASFVLPLGYSFNLDGSMMYTTFAVLFIAQAYGVQLGLAQKLTMLLLLMVTSKGIAGVPRASLVVIAATLVYFRIPEAGLLLILGVDHFLDMGRSATNVIGVSVAAAAVSKWEGELAPSPPDPVQAAA
jgi:Na+/H+-dicarboxylate symporter